MIVPQKKKSIADVTLDFRGKISGNRKVATFGYSGKS